MSYHVTLYLQRSVGTWSAISVQSDSSKTMSPVPCQKTLIIVAACSKWYVWGRMRSPLAPTQTKLCLLHLQSVDAVTTLSHFGSRFPPSSIGFDCCCIILCPYLCPIRVYQMFPLYNLRTQPFLLQANKWVLWCRRCCGSIHPHPIDCCVKYFMRQNYSVLFRR